MSLKTAVGHLRSPFLLPNLSSCQQEVVIKRYNTVETELNQTEGAIKILNATFSRSFKSF